MDPFSLFPTPVPATADFRALLDFVKLSLSPECCNVDAECSRGLFHGRASFQNMHDMAALDLFETGERLALNKGSTLSSNSHIARQVLFYDEITCAKHGRALDRVS